MTPGFWRGYGVIALASVLAAGCGGQGILNSPGESTEPVTSSSPSSPKPSRTVRPTPTGKRTTFNGVTLYLPKSWRRGPVTNGTTCVLPPGQRDCLGGALTIKKQKSKRDWPTGVLDQPGGWQGTAQPVCYAPGAVDPDHANSSGARVSASHLVAMANKGKAAYREWTVPCSSGKTFVVQLWFVAGKKIIFYVMGAIAEYGSVYEQIVTTADLGS